MKPISHIDAVIFDLDGTLFKTEDVAIPAFKMTFERLQEEGLFEREMPSDERFCSMFGYTLDVIWSKLLPEAGLQVREKANQWMLENEFLCLEQGKGSLYPGVVETLSALQSHGLKLFVASNGLEDYVKKVCEHYKISSLFQSLYSAGEYQTASKDDLVKLVIEQNSLENAVMVGDRGSDVQAGLANGLYVVGCQYGFADPEELKGAHQRIFQFSELREWLIS